MWFSFQCKGNVFQSPRLTVPIASAPLIATRSRLASKGASAKGTVSQDGDGILMSAIDKVEDIPSEARADG